MILCFIGWRAWGSRRFARPGFVSKGMSAFVVTVISRKLFSEKTENNSRENTGCRSKAMIMSVLSTVLPRYCPWTLAR